MKEKAAEAERIAAEKKAKQLLLQESLEEPITSSVFAGGTASLVSLASITEAHESQVTILCAGNAAGVINADTTQSVAGRLGTFDRVSGINPNA